MPQFGKIFITNRVASKRPVGITATGLLFNLGRDLFNC